MKPSETVSGSAERQLFFRALEKPAGEARAAFLDSACGNNPDLRQRLEALLQKSEALGTFLEEPAEPGEIRLTDLRTGASEVVLRNLNQ